MTPAITAAPDLRIARELAPAGDTLSVDDLRVAFRTRGGDVEALKGISFQIAPGERVGLVGESGSGKSVGCLSMMGLLDKNARVTSGHVKFGARTLLRAGAPMPRMPPPELAMIFQYPRTALHPIRTVGAQLMDVLASAEPAPKSRLKQRALQLFEEVRISRGPERMNAYPFELSGGQCQRILIAMALARKPRVLIADEPTTGLDVVTQRAIMELIAQARADHGMSCVLVTHDLALAGEFCDRIVVMKQGEVVEAGTTDEIFEAPQHPYTKGLLAATPALTHSLDALRAALARTENADD
jgi:peptide/nickel transport system ATP-binding protein